MPNHTYLNRGHGQTRPQQGPYKTILGHHEEAEGILKAACGLAPPVAPSEASNATACHHDSRVSRLQQPHLNLTIDIFKLTAILRPYPARRTSSKDQHCRRILSEAILARKVT